MLNTVGHHLYFMMLCMGMADGYTSDEEQEACKTRASEQAARLCQKDGWDKYDILEKKEQDILTEAARHWLFSIQTHSLWENFEESVKAMPSFLNHNQNELNDVYDALKSVAEADGIIDTQERVSTKFPQTWLLKGKGVSEHNVLEFVSAEWGLVEQPATVGDRGAYFAKKCACGTVGKLEDYLLQMYIDDKWIWYNCTGCKERIDKSDNETEDYSDWYPISEDEFLNLP